MAAKPDSMTLLDFEAAILSDWARNWRNRDEDENAYTITMFDEILDLLRQASLTVEVLNNAIPNR
jgi:hypothetical protein